MKSLLSFSSKSYMSDKKIVLSSLALDLKRVALGYRQGSDKMAQRFTDEALKRVVEARLLHLKPYLVDLLGKVERLSSEANVLKKSEDALMYSTLFQNAAIYS